VRVSLKSVSGVDSVDVSLAKGLATVKMRPGNTATLKQLQSAITKNGFTMKDSTATIGRRPPRLVSNSRFVSCPQNEVHN
jgi:hypothetical protein